MFNLVALFDEDSADSALFTGSLFSSLLQGENSITCPTCASGRHICSVTFSRVQKETFFMHYITVQILFLSLSCSRLLPYETQFHNLFRPDPRSEARGSLHENYAVKSIFADKILEELLEINVI